MGYVRDVGKSNVHAGAFRICVVAAANDASTVAPAVAGRWVCASTTTLYILDVRRVPIDRAEEGDVSYFCWGEEFDVAWDAKSSRHESFMKSDVKCKQDSFRCPLSFTNPPHAIRTIKSFGSAPLDLPHTVTCSPFDCIGKLCILLLFLSSTLRHSAS